MISILVGILSVVPAVQDGDPTQRIMKRIDQELREYRRRMVVEVRKTILEELQRAKARVPQPRKPEPKAEPGPAEPPARENPVLLGITVDDFTDAERKALDVPGGLKIAGVRGPAQEAGVRAGDILLEIGGEPVTERNIVELLSRYDPGDQAELTVLRKGKRRMLKVVFSERKD